MLFIKAFHLIAVIAWFSGLFYLPRLFVYHADARDVISNTRFKIMERRLYYGIIWPAAILATILGFWLLAYAPFYYLHASWMHAKLALVFLVWLYQYCCGHYLKLFARDSNSKSALFFRVFNEVPTVLLVGIVILVVVKP
jgi:putative membrane protein